MQERHTRQRHESNDHQERAHAFADTRVARGLDVTEPVADSGGRQRHRRVEIKIEKGSQRVLL